MSNTITCPNCQSEIEITEVVAAKVTADLCKEYEGKLQALEETLQVKFDKQKEQVELKAKSQAQKAMAVELKDREEQLKEAHEQLEKAQADAINLRKAQREIEQLKSDRDKDKEEIEQQLRIELREQNKKAIEQAVLEDRERQALELIDRDEQLTKMQQKLKEADERELAMRKRERELEERAEKVELEVNRKLDEERKQVRQTALKEAAEQQDLKIKEKDRIIESMRKQLEEAQRKAEQGSQQAQGEVLELALEDLLRNQFPGDAIEPVAKGVKGGDVVHRVFDDTGIESGTILWESKRTKNWQRDWLPKLRDDQRRIKAACAALVSIALPEGLKNFGCLDEVWVTSWSCVQGTALALRAVLIAAARSQRALVGQQSKMELVYNYLASPEFYNRVAGIAESFKAMKEDLESERRAFQKQWCKREKQLERALMNTAGLYGDLQGIIGSSLKEIEGISLLDLESGKESEPKVLVSGSEDHDQSD